MTDQEMIVLLRQALERLMAESAHYTNGCGCCADKCVDDLPEYHEARRVLNLGMMRDLANH